MTTVAQEPTPLPLGQSGADRDNGVAQVRWPHGQFYWAVLTLDAAPVSMRRLGTTQARAWLDGAFAPHLPREVDRVATAYARLPSGRVLACGVPVESLERLRSGRVETLAPESLPPWLDEDVSPDALNVLIAAHEPNILTSLRRRRSGLIAVTVAITASFAAVGFLRSAAASRDQLANANELLRQMASTPSGRPYASTDGVLDDARVTMDRERLRATRTSAARAGLSDSAPFLESVLVHWPKQLRTQVQSLSATSAQVSMNVLLPTHEDADALVAALKATQAVEAFQPQIFTGSRGVTLQLTLKSMASGSKPGGTP